MGRKTKSPAADLQRRLGVFVAKGEFEQQCFKNTKELRRTKRAELHDWACGRELCAPQIVCCTVRKQALCGYCEKRLF